ncbi:MAG: DEAD/DEAH box helicase, partial [Halobacteriota archaeon]
MDHGAASSDTFDQELVVDGVLERRTYQLDIARRAAAEDTLVCLPTGLGKTTVSLLVTAERLAAFGGKSLLLAPTKPLVTQHAAFYREALAVPDDAVVTFTGATPPDDRGALWSEATVVVATPQVVENDLVGSRIDLADVVHLTIDECHRTGGNYPYGFIADRYHETAEHPRVTGMSASPGETREEIVEVCERLGLTAVEVRTADDPDVEPYTHETDVEWIEVELPEGILEIRSRLREVTESRLEQLADLGVADTTSADCSQRDLDRMRAKLQSRLEAGDTDAYTGLSLHAEVMKLRRALELVETQSVRSLRQYFERRAEAARSSGASKADQRFLSDPRVREAMELAREYDELHPKFRQARILIAETLGIKDGERVLVFTESRDTAEQLTSFLGEHFDTRRFVGQGDREHSDGMSQREQRDAIEAFRRG